VKYSAFLRGAEVIGTVFWRYAASALSSAPEKSACLHSIPRSFVHPTMKTATALPASIAPLLGAPGVAALPGEFLPGRPRAFRAVVLILLDGFGWRFFEKIVDDYPALRRFAAARGVAKLTSQFPSTTAAHVTCLHTGLEVGQSGVYEWQNSDSVTPWSQYSLRRASSWRPAGPPKRRIHKIVGDV
jgi:hypothetical protein